MKKVEIFDPAMCCTTGVCGPSVDKELMRIAAVINSLTEQGIDIQRHGLSTEPQDFVSNKVISDALQQEGADVLPITILDGEIVKTRKYPTDEELSSWLGIPLGTSQPGPFCCGGVETVGT